MATHRNDHQHIDDSYNGLDEEPSVGGVFKRTLTQDVSKSKLDISSVVVSSCSLKSSSFDEDPNSPISKKAKFYHQPSSTISDPSCSMGMTSIPFKEDTINITSPSVDTIILGGGSHAYTSQITKIPPTLQGISGAAIVLQASKLSIFTEGGRVGDEISSTQQDTKVHHEFTSKNIGHQGSNTPTPANTTPQPLLLSFPTESVYMLACCVKPASPRSLRKMVSRNDSQTSYSSTSSSSKGDLGVGLEDFIHPSNASLEWLVKCNKNNSMVGDINEPPYLFVLDGIHALSFCHFTKPRTFAIRPSTLTTSSSDDSVNLVAAVPSTSIKPSSPLKMKDAAPSQLPVPYTPTSQATTGLTSHRANPITPNTQKLYAASFSESREAFLRLASKLWPGPIAIYTRVRTFGGDDVSPKLSASTSMASLTSLQSIGDSMYGGNLSPSIAKMAILPESVLIPATQLLPIRGGEGNEVDDRQFVGLRCPSHPLSRKILNEIYHNPARLNTSPSTDSIISMSSLDNSSCGNSRVRSSIAVVGSRVHGLPSTSGSLNSHHVTTAADVGQSMAAMMQSSSLGSNRQENKARLFIVDGEDNRESFSVPTCQYGKPHHVSLAIDGDNKTIYLIRHDTEAHGISKAVVHRALTTPVTSSSDTGLFSLKPQATATKKGDAAARSIDRVITAVLSRWKIEEIHS